MIKCNFVHCLYEDDSENGSGYIVAIYQLIEAVDEEYPPELKSEKFTAVGYYLSKLPKTTICLNGVWKKDAKHGLQYIVSECSEIVEKTEFGITSFLSSGLVKGIGKGLASRIYKKFKDETLDIFDNHIERLIEVPGISQKKLDKIRESYKLVAGSRELITFLGKYKVKPKVAQKVTQCGITLNDIKSNPYSILKVRGIGFPTADLINMGLGLSYHSPERLCAAISFGLKVNELNGNCGIKKEILMESVRKTLNVSIKDGPVTSDEIAKQIILMIDRKEIIPVKGIYYRAEMYWAECDVAKEIVRLMAHPVPAIENLEEKLKEWEKDNDMSFDSIQENAVITALSCGFSVITGGPGRGKTTVAKAIVEIREKYGEEKTVQLMAPTGRAAKRLSDSTGSFASTIHAALKISDDEGEANESIEAEQLLVDEVSMVDIWLMRTLLQSVPDGCNVTLIGDYNQLPSVKAGAVLRDIIASKVVPVVELQKVYRQADGSTIVENAEKINKGDIKLIINDEFQCYKATDGKTAAKTMIYLYKDAIKTYERKEVALLSPFHHAKSEASSDSVNAYLQEILNKADGEKKEMSFRNRPFREGDIVMQTQNKNGICNGDIGIINSIHMDEGELVMEVLFDGNEKYEYSASELDIVELAYCMTYHKSQGSEYECVIGCLLDEHKRMLKRNLLYTGVTRAKKCFKFVGSPTALSTAIRTVDTENRITLLKEKIVYALKQQAKDNPFLTEKAS